MSSWVIEFDAEKRDLLKDKPNPTPEEAHAVIQTERDQRLIMGSESQTGEPSLVTVSEIGAGLVAKPPDGPPVDAADHPVQ